MTKKNKEIKIYVAERDGYICQKCGKYASNGHIAHRIAETKLNKRLFGEDIIDHPFNKSWVCSLECNSSYNIGNNPRKRVELYGLIKSRGNEKFTAKQVDDFIKKE